MDIIDVIIFRDGGTITITIENDPKAGAYTLPTPFQPEPRPIYWNKKGTKNHKYRSGEMLGVGSAAEAEFLAKLNQWREKNIDDKLRRELKYLKGLSGWRDFPETLDKTIMFYRIQAVIDYLQTRHSSRR